MSRAMRALARHPVACRAAFASPFGTRRAMPVYMQKTIADLERIVINGGSRGFLVELAPSELVRVLEPTLVDVVA